MNFLLKMMSNKSQSDVIKLSFGLLKRQGKSNIKNYFTAPKFVLRVKLTNAFRQTKRAERELWVRPKS